MNSAHREVTELTESVEAEEASESSDNALEVGCKGGSSGGMPRTKRVLIVGTDSVACRVADELMKHGEPCCEVVGFVEDDPDDASRPAPVVGGRSDILKLAGDLNVDEVIVSDPSERRRGFIEEALGNEHERVQIKIVPGIYEAMLGMLPFDTIADIPIVQLGRFRRTPTYEGIKKLTEKLVACLALMLSSPILALAMLAIKFTSKGPPIYRQERVGYKDHIFTLYKLRTMVCDAEEKTGPVLSAENDCRVTLVGRLLRATKIDELPQLVNVLKGQMSIIGPRPERPAFVAEFKRTIPGYAERHRTRPGITGLAQVYGDYLTPAETKLRYDLMYLYNQSLWLDTKIVLLTARGLLREAFSPVAAAFGRQRRSRRRTEPRWVGEL